MARRSQRPFDLIDLSRAVSIFEEAGDHDMLNWLPQEALPDIERMVKQFVRTRNTYTTDATVHELAIQLKQLAEEVVRENSKYARTEAANDAEPTVTFTQFPALPLELRRQIWGHALPGPRILEVYALLPNGVLQLSKINQIALIPLLKACSESHEAVNSHYRTWHPSLFQYEQPQLGRPSSTFDFDPLRDILYLSSHLATKRVIGISSSKISRQLADFQSLAINLHDLNYGLHGDQGGLYLEWISKMTNLKRIVAVSNSSNQEKADKMLYHGIPLKFISCQTPWEGMATGHTAAWRRNVQDAWKRRYTRVDTRWLQDVALEFAEIKRDYYPALLSSKLKSLHIERNQPAPFSS